MKRIMSAAVALLLLAGTMPLIGPPAEAASVLKRNLVDLIDLSDRIIVGKVLSVNDGFDINNVPYTEVTLLVEENIRGGNPGNTYTFRQFGLMAPREIDGKTYLSVSPDGWPKFAADERVVVFLYQPASITGLQTTVGLFQGKFSIAGGQVRNVNDNLGLFENIQFEPGLLNEAEQKCSASTQGAVPENVFVPMVRRAVDDQWVEEGRMSNEN